MRFFVFLFFDEKVISLCRLVGMLNVRKVIWTGLIPFGSHPETEFVSHPPRVSYRQTYASDFAPFGIGSLKNLERVNNWEIILFELELLLPVSILRLPEGSRQPVVASVATLESAPTIRLGDINHSCLPCQSTTPVVVQIDTIVQYKLSFPSGHIDPHFDTGWSWDRW